MKGITAALAATLAVAALAGCSGGTQAVAAPAPSLTAATVAMQRPTTVVKAPAVKHKHKRHHHKHHHKHHHSIAVDTSGTAAHPGTVSTPQNDPAPEPTTDPTPKPHVCTDGEVRHFPAGYGPDNSVDGPSKQVCKDNAWGPPIPDPDAAPRPPAGD